MRFSALNLDAFVIDWHGLFKFVTRLEHMSRFYAHTKNRPDGSLCPDSEWEPLFSEGCLALKGKPCSTCEALDPRHGHLNKVAHLSAKFAVEMFPEGSEDSKTARQWGFLAGLWHDLGKFSDAFQKRLLGEREKANHSTAGADLLNRLQGRDDLIRTQTQQPLLGLSFDDSPSPALSNVRALHREPLESSMFSQYQSDFIMTSLQPLFYKMNYRITHQNHIHLAKTLKTYILYFV